MYANFFHLRFPESDEMRFLLVEADLSQHLTHVLNNAESYFFLENAMKVLLNMVPFDNQFYLNNDTNQIDFKNLHDSMWRKHNFL